MNVDIEGVGEIKVSDITEVSISDDSGEYYALVNGNPGLIISIQKQSLSNTVDVADSINETMERLMAENEGFISTPFLTKDIISMLLSIACSTISSLGAILAIAVLAIFLRSIRPTVIIAFSIPISLLFASR